MQSQNVRKTYHYVSYLHKIVVAVFLGNLKKKVHIFQLNEIESALKYVVYQWLATGRWFSPSTPVSTTNNTDCHDISEILLKVVLNTITLNQLRYVILRHQNKTENRTETKTINILTLARKSF